MQDAELLRFYESAYSQDAEASVRHSRWRALSAVGKAAHVIELCTRADLRPDSVLDVGCGDGALLGELHNRGFGVRRAGVEIAEQAVASARERDGVDSVDRFDGRTLPFPDEAFDLGILSHVLEHVREPTVLLTEVARVCRAVLVEVPLEANLSAERSAKRLQAVAVGHLQRFTRGDMRATVSASGLRIVAEMEDPLPLAVHRFHSATARSRAVATVRWALRAGMHRSVPPLARRVFTLHFACLCVHRDIRPH
ncbi:MAG TPA: class I SAM-dependent methyltransferase [Solirubrobacteraceae bacterium]|nr:class I SAM-dependent methyltransferase [Solirubrobacteraceae bacterium]